MKEKTNCHKCTAIIEIDRTEQSITFNGPDSNPKCAVKLYPKIHNNFGFCPRCFATLDWSGKKSS